MVSGQKKRMGFLDALTIGIGTMIGAGIFVLSGTAAKHAGPAAMLSFVLSGVAVMPTALSFAELATAFPTAGGPYAFVRRAFGPFAGFVTGWSLWVGLSLTSAFYCIGFAYYIGYFFSLPWQVAAWGSALVILYTNAAGGSSSARLQTWSVMILLLLLAVYVGAGWFRLDRELHSHFFPYGFLPVLQASTYVFVSFLGFELIATAAEEVKNPMRTLPLATISSVIVVAAIYAAIVFVATGLRSYVDLGQSRTPIADTAEIILGEPGGAMIGLAGLLATFSSANGSIMAASRICYAMARNADLPAWLHYIHPNGSPTKAIASTGLLVTLAIFAGNAEQLAAAAGFLHLYPFVLVNLAVFFLRGQPDYRPSFRIPGGISIPLTGAALSLLLISQVTGISLLTAFLLLLPGIGFFLWHRVPIFQFK